MRTKLVFGLLFAVAALLVAVVPATASRSSGHESDPQEANIPYLAWTGENVKLARIFDWGFFPGLTDQSVAGLKEAGYEAELAVMNWTGDPAYKPTVINGTLGANGMYHGSFFYVRNGGLYASGVVVDDHPGIAKIKLFVTKGGDLVKEQVFEVAFMTIVDPTLHEMSNADLAAVSDEQPSLGDPNGDGVFVPMPVVRDHKLAVLTSKWHDSTATVNDFGLGYLQVKVKGTFPFPNILGKLTMPDDWAALAADPVYGAMTKDGPDPLAWDIHGHAAGHHWDSNDATPLFGGHLKIGPFDPLFPGDRSFFDTMLPDGKLDATDAPMPADRIDVNIAAGGVGELVKVEKSDVYVMNGHREWDGSSFIASDRSHWEDLYAPFYEAFIPATAREGGSGIDAANYAGNFPGFLVRDNPYEFWALVQHSSDNPDRATNPNTCKDELGKIRQSPEDAIDHVTVYTDEHGEAIVGYNPDAGFYFTSDSNKRCDLGDGSARVLLGTSVIQATAVYPYEQSAGGSVATNTLTKSVYGLPMKQLTFTAKSSHEAIVTETIHDIYGNPVSGAEVQFSVEPTGPQLVKEIGGGPASSTTGSIILTTNANGQAAVDVISTLKGKVDVLVENLGTRVSGAGVLRDMMIDFSGSMPVVAGGGSVTTPTTPSGPSGGGSTTTTTVVTTTAGTTTTTATVISKSTAKVSAKVTVAKIVVTKSGRFVTVKVISPASKAKVMIKLLGKNGKVLKSVTRNLPTNQVVRIGGLTLTKLTRSVTAGVVR